MTLPADAHIGSVSLTVTDLERSIAFYRDLLGFAVSIEARDLESRQVEDAATRVVVAMVGD